MTSGNYKPWSSRKGISTEPWAHSKGTLVPTNTGLAPVGTQQPDTARSKMSSPRALTARAAGERFCSHGPATDPISHRFAGPNYSKDFPATKGRVDTARSNNMTDPLTHRYQGDAAFFAHEGHKRHNPLRFMATDPITHRGPVDREQKLMVRKAVGKFGDHNRSQVVLGDDGELGRRGFARSPQRRAWEEACSPRAPAAEPAPPAEPASLQRSQSEQAVGLWSSRPLAAPPEQPLGLASAGEAPPQPEAPAAQPPSPGGTTDAGGPGPAAARATPRRLGKSGSVSSLASSTSRCSTARGPFAGSRARRGGPPAGCWAGGL